MHARCDLELWHFIVHVISILLCWYIMLMYRVHVRLAPSHGLRSNWREQERERDRVLAVKRAPLVGLLLSDFI